MYRYRLVDRDTGDAPLRFQIQRSKFLLWENRGAFSIGDLRYYAKVNNLPWDMNAIALRYFREWVDRERAAEGPIPLPRIIARL